MVVEVSNVFSEARDEYVSVLNSNIIDPKTGTRNSRRRWFYRDFPDTTSRNFDGYPIIVVRSPEVSDDLQDLQGCLSDADIIFVVEVYAEFNDEDARVDEMSNSVYSVTRNYDNQDTLKKTNLHRPSIDAGPYETQNEDNKRLSMRRFVVTFESTLEV